MKNLYAALVLAGALSTTGCISDDADGPNESTVTGEVRIGQNWVRAHSLALRTCANPGACDTGARLQCHSIVIVDQIITTTNPHMAHMSSPNGYAISAGTDGDPYIWGEDGPCL
jgi:hypothetical protein